MASFQIWRDWNLPSDKYQINSEGLEPLSERWEPQPKKKIQAQYFRRDCHGVFHSEGLEYPNLSLALIKICLNPQCLQCQVRIVDRQTPRFDRFRSVEVRIGMVKIEAGRPERLDGLSNHSRNSLCAKLPDVDPITTVHELTCSPGPIVGRPELDFLNISCSLSGHC